MARKARITVPHLPHHITQRGNRRQEVFFRDADYLYYLNLLEEWSHHYDVQIWAYCLMPNHVHIIAVPADQHGLSETMAQVHRRYTRYINFQKGWCGHLWQSRFASFVMDEGYLLNCARHVALNPVRANLCQTAFDWPWCSAPAHLSQDRTTVCQIDPLLERIGDWAAFLKEGLSPEEVLKWQAYETGNRPVGSERFIDSLEDRLGLCLRPQKPGPKSQMRMYHDR